MTGRSNPRNLLSRSNLLKETVFLISSQFPCPIPHDAISRANAECAISSWQRIKLLYKNVKGFASEPLSGT